MLAGSCHTRPFTCEGMCQVEWTVMSSLSILDYNPLSAGAVGLSGCCFRSASLVQGKMWPLPETAFFGHTWPGSGAADLSVRTPDSIQINITFFLVLQGFLSPTRCRQCHPLDLYAGAI